MRPPRIPNWLPGDSDTIYFLTVCVEGRHAVLDNPAAWNLCREVWRRLDRWHIHAAIAMPDHLHLLLSPLRDRDASLSAWMKWFKRWFNEGYAEACRASVSDASVCRASLRDAGEPSHRDGLQCTMPSGTDGLLRMPWRWMEGGFDHLLRGDESAQEKWHYMRLNPVRAGLVTRPEDWPYQMGLGEVL